MPVTPKIREWIKLSCWETNYILPYRVSPRMQRLIYDSIPIVMLVFRYPRFKAERGAEQNHVPYVCVSSQVKIQKKLIKEGKSEKSLHHEG